MANYPLLFLAFTKWKSVFPVVLSEYPAFLVPSIPIAYYCNRRSIVPMFYNTGTIPAVWWLLGKNETKDTQTEAEPQQAENLNENKTCTQKATALR